MSPLRDHEFLGAVCAAGTMKFRVWAPEARSLEVVFADAGCPALALSRSESGYFSGPGGNYLKCFSPHYFGKRHRTEWGGPFNFDEQHSHGARDFIVGNVCYWVRKFHLEGFRLDATQAIVDTSPRHILAELTQRARTAALPRHIVVIAENEPQCSDHLLPVQARLGRTAAAWRSFQAQCPVLLMAAPRIVVSEVSA